MGMASGAMADCDTGDTGSASVPGGAAAGNATCDVDVTLDVAEQVTIEGLEDLDMGTYNSAGAPALTAAADSASFCLGAVGLGSADVTFTTSASGLAAGVFGLTGDTEGDEVAYQIAFNDGSGGGLASVTSGTAITVDADELDDIGCSGTGGTAASMGLSVGYAAAAFDDAADTAYTDTVTVLVEPN